MNIDTKAQALEGDNITDVVAKVVHLLRIEFLGEGYIDKDSPQYAEKYVHALLKLELNNICLLDKYICIFHVTPQNPRCLIDNLSTSGILVDVG